ncbi:hypothetical protein KGQ20_15315 [Catenulispora sp. NF23]|uniref:Uncharacterized protein n=1 Tax=Catenulispora pinistramenti TaxID=2705254 RepID=A0ABS5KUN8_9ACTN|nr:hypothetical protein [Catenulispora pinistramenti]MBS2534142.1 hypothetical protein [Catenulispora pinistramenti]MBS2549763.1 hypothetical protein [Catenulispora pinistramenti]
MTSAPYTVVFGEHAMTQVALLPDADIGHVVGHVAIGLGRDPHLIGDPWMSTDAQTWYTLDIGPTLRVAYVVDDKLEEVAILEVLVGHS